MERTRLRLAIALAAPAFLHCGGASTGSWSTATPDSGAGPDAPFDATTPPPDDASAEQSAPLDAQPEAIEETAPATLDAAPDAYPVDAFPSDGPSLDGGDAATADAAPDAEAGPPGPAWFRIAQFAADGHSYDFRWRPTGAATWNGPIAAGWGLDGGLAYGALTEEVPIQAVSTDVSVTYPGGPQNDATIVPATNEIDTIVVFSLPGSYGGTFRYPPNVNVRAFADERSVDAGQAAIRAVHVATTSGMTSADGTSATGPMYFLAGSTTLLANVPYGGIAPQSAAADARGYAWVAPIASTTLQAVRPPPQTFPAYGQVTAWSAQDGHSYSLFLSGLYANQTFPVQLAACDDTVPAVNHLRSCSTM